jgi:transcriptional regulator GlxA family with amidase domain
LAHLNLLDGRKFATHYSVADAILNFCTDAIYEPHKRYVHSGPISTSAGVTAGMDLALDLVERYVGEKLRIDVEKYISYDRKKVM